MKLLLSLLSLATCASALAASAPVVTSLTNPAPGEIDITWTPALGGTARVKRDCQLSCGYGHIYYVHDTGSVTLVGQPTGLHYYRVCQAFCSLPKAINAH